MSTRGQNKKVGGLKINLRPRKINNKSGNDCCGLISFLQKIKSIWIYLGIAHTVFTSTDHKDTDYRQLLSL